MELSTKARYTVRALIELSLHYGQGPLMLKEIARRQEIPDKYLEQLMAPLRVQNIVYTIRGNKGGYMLSKPPEEITIYEVVTTVKGSVAPVPCVEKEDFCNRMDICASRDVWCDLHQKIAEVLKNTTLAELAEKQVQRRSAEDNRVSYTL